LAAAEASAAGIGYCGVMATISSLAETASLIGEPARTAMLVALMDGRALTAGELARASGITPPTASGHLARLTEAGLLAVSAQGRHRYFRIASPAVARMIEGMMGVAGLVEATRANRPIVTGPKNQALRHARICYDHLAGEVAVRLADSLVASGHVDLTPDGAAVTQSGLSLLHTVGLNLDGSLPEWRARATIVCRTCMDWSERRPHLSGLVGRLLFEAFVDRRWLRRASTGRAVMITPAGAAALARHFGVVEGSPGLCPGPAGQGPDPST
jgi:DNA-binding transcriptional ArsR family regulator